MIALIQSAMSYVRLDRWAICMALVTTSALAAGATDERPEEPRAKSVENSDRTESDAEADYQRTRRNLRRARAHAEEAQRHVERQLRSFHSQPPLAPDFSLLRRNSALAREHAEEAERQIERHLDSFHRDFDRFSKTPVEPLHPFPPAEAERGTLYEYSTSRRSGTSYFRDDDRVVRKARDGDRTAIVRGEIVDGKERIRTIDVTDGDETRTFRGLDEVPEKYRKLVRSALD